MELGPATLSDLENDLVLSDDDVPSRDGWPPLARYIQPASSSAAMASTGLLKPPSPGRDIQATTHTKRPVEEVLNSSGESLSPAVKTSKYREVVTAQRRVSRQAAQECPPSGPPTRQKQPPQPAFSPPAFAPRKDYVKLLFKESPSVDTKLRWLAEVNREFQLDRELAEVKMSAVNFTICIHIKTTHGHRGQSKGPGVQQKIVIYASKHS